MNLSLTKRETILGALAELQPPGQFDEPALTAFVGARQRLIDELQALGDLGHEPLNDNERSYRTKVRDADDGAVRLVRDQRTTILSAMTQQRRMQQHVHDYGSESGRRTPLLDRKG